MKIPRLVVSVLTTAAVLSSALVGGTAAVADVSTDGLLAHYEFSETSGATVADLSGHSANGTVVGTPTWTGASLKLAGGANNATYVKLPDNLLKDKAAATISTQVKADAASLSRATFLFNIAGTSGTSGGGDGTGSWFVSTNGTMRSTITNANWTGEQSATWTGRNLTAGAWTNVTTTIAANTGASTSTITLYINGTQVAQNAAATLNLTNLTNHLNNRLGGSAYAGDFGFGGEFSTFRAYERALSSTEVAELSASDSQKTAQDVLNAISLGDLSNIREDLVLPGGGITWATSNAAVITAGGAITRPAVGAASGTATLTASVTSGGVTQTKAFSVTVPALEAGETTPPPSSALLAHFPLNEQYPGTTTSGTGTLTGGLNAPVWKSNHVDLTGGGYIAANSGTGITNTSTSLTVSVDVKIPGTATGTPNSTVFTYGSNATTNGLSYRPFWTTNSSAAVITIGSTQVVAETNHAQERDVWTNITVVLNDAADTLTVYENGAQIAQKTGVTQTATTLGNGVLRLNREGTGFTNLPSLYRNLKLYSVAATADQALALSRTNAQFAWTSFLDGLNFGDTGAVVSNVVLPGSPVVTWTSSNPAVVSTSGTVTRPAAGQSDAVVTLTASSSRGGTQFSQAFELTVPAEYTAQKKAEVDAAALSVHDVDGLRSITTLTGTGSEYGSTITWATSDAATVALVTDDGVVYADPKRPGYGHEAGAATLTATVTNGEASTTADFPITVPAAARVVPDEGYAFAYFTANTVAGENIYLAASNGNNALSWNTLNNGNYILTSEFGEKGLRDPYIIRSEEGDKFFMIATDLSIGRNGDWGRAQTNGSQYIEIWESTDLVNWTEQRHVKVAPDTAGMTWAPEAYYDDELGEYVVFWASRLFTDSSKTTCITTDSGSGCYARMVYATTKDFITFSEPRMWQDTGKARIDSTVLKEGDYYYRFTKDEGSGQSGCADIISERSTSLTTETTAANLGQASAWGAIESCISKNAGRNVAVEGPTIFKANEGDTSPYDYYLYVDNFGGSGYFPLGTNDISKPTWNVASGSLPSSRHGTVLPITKNQWNSATGAAAQTTESTTALVYSEDDGTLTATVAAADGHEAGGKVVFSTGDWSKSAYLIEDDGDYTATVEAPEGFYGANGVTAAFQGTAEITESSALEQIDFPAAALESIAITTAPTKTSYTIGDSFDPAGLAVTASFEDGTTQALSSDSLSITGFSSTVAGSITITVSYTVGSNTATATFPVTINEPVANPVQSLTINSLPERGIYGVGESFDPTGVSATAHYLDGSSVTVQADGLTYSGVSFSSIGTKTVTATYTDGTSSVSTTFDVLVVKNKSTVSVSPSKTSQVYGKAVTLTAKVSSGATGRVEFFAGSKSLGNATIKGSSAVKTGVVLPAGSHKITAKYWGSSTVKESTSSAKTLKVTKATVSSVKVSGKKFAKNSKPKVTVTVSKLNNGSYPVGTVTVKVGSTSKKVTLKASSKGKVTVTLSKRYSKSISVKATFVPKDTKNVSSKSSKATTIKVKR